MKVPPKGSIASRREEAAVLLNIENSGYAWLAEAFPSGI